MIMKLNPENIDPDNLVEDANGVNYEVTKIGDSVIVQYVGDEVI